MRADASLVAFSRSTSVLEEIYSSSKSWFVAGQLDLAPYQLTCTAGQAQRDRMQQTVASRRTATHQYPVTDDVQGAQGLQAASEATVANLVQLQQPDQLGTTGHGHACEQGRQQQITRLQRWLLLLRHCAKCQLHEAECQLQGTCRVGKELWTHILQCNNHQCSYPHCTSSKDLLKHHQKCQVRRLLVALPRVCSILV